MTTTTILPTRNPEWGFWGTTDRAGYRADRGWDIASTMVAKATGGSPEGVRDLLDSRHGRHFADDVASAASSGMPVELATENAIEKWQGWKIDSKTSREHGIPAGLPYLTGWVGHFEIAADAE